MQKKARPGGMDRYIDRYTFFTYGYIWPVSQFNTVIECTTTLNNRLYSVYIKRICTHVYIFFFLTLLFTKKNKSSKNGHLCVTATVFDSLFTLIIIYI